MKISNCKKATKMYAILRRNSRVEKLPERRMHFLFFRHLTDSEYFPSFFSIFFEPRIVEQFSRCFISYFNNDLISIPMSPLKSKPRNEPKKAKYCKLARSSFPQECSLITQFFRLSWSPESSLEKCAIIALSRVFGQSRSWDFPLNLGGICCSALNCCDKVMKIN